MKLIYNVEDKPKLGRLIIFAFQQLLAIMAATIAVPATIGNGMSSAAALFGAGVGSLVYILFTKKKSPVFLGSSFAFLGSMFAAFAGGVSMSLGYLGLILGALFAGLVYVIIALIVKIAGVKWIDKLMPAVVIGPTVAIIALSLAGNAVGDFSKGDVLADVIDETGAVIGTAPTASTYLCMACGLVTLFVTMLCSTYGKKVGKLIPFIIGIFAGYAVAAALTIYGTKTGNPALQIIDFAPFISLFENGVTVNSIVSIPDFTFLKAVDGIKELDVSYISSIAVAYIPVAFVVFAEHIADHKNLSTIIDRDLLTEPGLSRTLLGDGIGSFAGALFGGCPNTTYGESVACVAITKNASVYTIIGAAISAIVISFFSPFVAFLDSIPSCVMGGVCIALYGFIAVSGLKMVQKVNLNENKNLFVVSAILITGLGGLSISIDFPFGTVTITTIATALILGIITNLILRKGKSEEESEETAEAVEETAEAAEENPEVAEEAAEEAAEETAEEVTDVAEETTEAVEEVAEEVAEEVTEAAE